MNLQADAVARPVRNAGQGIARAETARFRFEARRCIDRRAGRAQPGGLESGQLAGLFGVPDLAFVRGGCAEDIAARDIRLIAVQGTAGIDQHHVARFQGFRPGDAVRESRVRSEQHDAEHRPARRTDRLVRLVDEFGDLAGGDAGTQDARRRLVHFQRRCLGRLHQRQLVGILALPCRQDQRVAVATLSGPAAFQGAGDAQRRGRIDRQITALQERAHEGVGALMFFPAAQRCFKPHEAFQRAALELRPDIGKAAICAQQGADQAL